MNLNGQEGEVRFTLEIKRANGQVETIDLVGKIGGNEQIEPQQLEEKLVHLS